MFTLSKGDSYLNTSILLHAVLECSFCSQLAFWAKVHRTNLHFWCVVVFSPCSSSLYFHFSGLNLLDLVFKAKVSKPIKKTVLNIFPTSCHRNLGCTIISLQIISNVVYYGPWSQTCFWFPSALPRIFILITHKHCGGNLKFIYGFLKNIMC